MSWEKGFKRAAGLLLVAALSVGLFGCSGRSGTATSSAVGGSVAASSAPVAPVTLKILTWTNPADLEAIAAINEKVKGKYPNITIDLTDVPSSDYDQVCSTRISAKDVDIVTYSGLPAPTPDWAKGATQDKAHQWIEGGVFEDLTDQPFTKLYLPNVVKEGGSYNGKVYGIPTGSVAFTGVFYNKDIFQQNGLSVPKTWSEFEKVCTTLKNKGITPMTIGQGDGWARALPEEALQDSLMGPNLLEAVRKIWAGESKYTDQWGIDLYTRWMKMVSWFDPNFTATPYDAVPGIFASGKVAMLPDGIWQAPLIVKANPDINMGYFPLPGSDDASKNASLQGKYDMALFVTSASLNKQAAYDWINVFSEKENYTGYCDTTGFMPTQEGIQLSSKFFNEEILPYQKTFSQAIEKYMFNPTGLSSDYSFDNVAPMGRLTDPVKAAEGYQKAWENALAKLK